MSLVRKAAPHFAGDAWFDDNFKAIKLEDYKGKYLLLFFYPLDFTFVCPTEIISFSNHAKAFKDVNCEVVGCSVDSKFTHMEYAQKPRKQGGLGGINIPLLSDITKKISIDYGCLITEGGDQGISFRATYIIDDKGIVRHESVNDLPVGRNPDEFLRMVTAFQYADKHGEVCPANWHPGSRTMIPNPKNNNYKEVISEAK
jgi:alkyl hydroperoxide reductase subunit AhpC